jgi:translation initiation factor IF-2
MEDTDPRAPVITVMGHVDHGKTSLLDAIRQARVAEGEAGGITQHIGAYSVNVPNPDNTSEMRRVVFLDTPGHEAFTMMRARGARVTDIVVLVVAADDGVMPQTVEAIDHAKAAKVPIVVAINKVDKPDANADRVKKELADRGLLWDGWGGDTTMVEVSAKMKRNIEGLLEMVLLTADILDLKANPRRKATGTVLEAKLDRGRGSVATVLIQNGTLRVGDPLIAGNYFGKVRALMNEFGQRVQAVAPATPVEVLGLEGVPAAGDQFQVVDDIAKAQQIGQFRQSKARVMALARTAARGLDQLAMQMKTGEVKELLVILKADVQGSVEVLKDTLTKLSTEKVKVRIIRAGVGAITYDDVLLASASNATETGAATVIIGFNVRPEARADDAAKQENVDIRLHSIIYKVEEEIRNSMLGLMEATTKETVIGKAEVRDVIRVPKVGAVAGCMVTSGSIKRTAHARLIRDNVVVFETNIGSLRRFKEDVSEVQQGYECGITVERFNDYKVGDVIEAFITEKVAPTKLE